MADWCLWCGGKLKVGRWRYCSDHCSNLYWYDIRNRKKANCACGAPMHPASKRCRRCSARDPSRKGRRPYHPVSPLWRDDAVHDVVFRLLAAGKSRSVIAQEVAAAKGVDVTKNMVVSFLQRADPPGPSTLDRLQALHDKMDAVLL